MKAGQWGATVAGVWLMAAPAVGGYVDDGAADVHRTIGPLMATFGVVALWPATRDVRWVNVVLAAVLAVAPIFGGHGASATAVALGTAAVVAATTPWGGADPDRRGTGWRGVVGRGLEKGAS